MRNPARTKLFGDNVDERRKLELDAAVELFDRVWSTKLERPVMKAEVCDSDEAYERLTERQQSFFDHSQGHRSFRIQALNAEFIIQLAQTRESEYTLTRLWRVSSSDTHPKALFVTFDTVEEREQFRLLAINLGIGDEELGLRLIRDFIEKHPGRF